MNPRHADFQSAALPTELPDHGCRTKDGAYALRKAFVSRSHIALVSLPPFEDAGKHFTMTACKSNPEICEKRYTGSEGRFRLISTRFAKVGTRYARRYRERREAREIRRVQEVREVRKVGSKVRERLLKVVGFQRGWTFRQGFGMGFRKLAGFDKGGRFG